MFSKNNLLYSILFSIVIVLVSCKTTTTTSNKINIFSDDYYINNASNNLERLKLLFTGLYVQQSENLKKETYYTWKVNEGMDSILYYSTSIGVPSKDGHWLYMCQFMSHLPNEPLYSAFQKFEKISRDTIQIIFYENPKIVPLDDLLKKGSSYFNNIDFKNLEASGETITCVKKGSASFSGLSHIYANPKKNKNDYRVDRYEVQSQKFKFRSEFYEDKEGKKFLYKNPIISHLVRLDHTTHPLFVKKKK